jgi:sulfatase maturation enzyme AslB (radical SAM superfamily)
MKNFAQRVTKHARLNWQSLPTTEVPSPPFVIFFINSLCNMKCEHCFYWQQLNQKTDLTFEEIVALSEELKELVCGHSLIVCLPALIRSASTSSA